MSFSFGIEKREHEWHAYVREVPGTGSLGPTPDDALAGALRKLTEKVERRELSASLDMFVAEAPPSGLKSFTGADLLALWERLPHPGAAWADAVEEATRSQSSILEEPTPWER